MANPAEERYLVPRRLDDPPQFFLWDFDEAALVIACTVLFSISGGLGFLVGIALGLLAARGLSTLKLQGGLSTILAFLWWYSWSDPWWRAKHASNQASNSCRELVG
ncbi:MAG: type IV conjugative transfer system protein TraL [Caldilineae bacterium]|nr:MAG: type IV conjugative transfer system protein TraL [Caldilineae bacterium]